MEDISPRQQAIMKRVRTQGFVAIDALAQDFDMTPQTIRRDINQLCDRGILQRYHGGAGLPSTVENVAYNDRQVMHLEAKQRIAQRIATQIPDQASMFITLGTTTEEVAKALLQHQGLRVITNNLNVAHILSNNPGFEVIIAGGLVRSRDRGVTGEATIDFMRQFRVDFGVIGISGIDTDGAMLDFDYREVRVVQAIMAHSRRVWLGADHSKFGRNAMVQLGRLQEMDAVFTDRPPPEEWSNLFEEADTRLEIASD